MPLLAGSAVRDISPIGPMSLYGYPHVKRISTGIHDPLLASVLWMDHAGVGLVMVALDLLFLDPPLSRLIRRRVATTLGIPEAGVFISFTHTHSGPVTAPLVGWQNDSSIPAPDPAYLAMVGDRVVEAASAAKAAAAPAELAWTCADASGVGGNRLSREGVTDPECGVLAVRSAAGANRLIAVAVIYGMHPTVLHEDSTLVSSDFPHYTRQHLRERFGEGVTVLYHTAPCGNQSPRYFVNGQTFAEAERLGRKLGAAVAGSLGGIKDVDWSSSPCLGTALEPVDLPRRRLLPLNEARALLEEYRSRYEHLKAVGAPRPEIRTAECAVFGAEGTVGLAEAEASGAIDRLLARYAPIEVQALQIGDVRVVGLPGECFTDYALAIKRAAKTRTFVVSLVNGELQGYIVTPEAFAAGGYEATNAIYAPESGDVLVKTALALVKQLAKQ
jgi:neutral ceramidase